MALKKNRTISYKLSINNWRNESWGYLPQLPKCAQPPVAELYVKEKTIHLDIWMRYLVIKVLAKEFLFFFFLEFCPPLQ